MMSDKTWGERVDAGERPAEAYMAVTELAEAAGATPIKDRMWTHQIDERWRVTCNGFMVDQPISEGATATLPPLNMFIEYNGWPAGIIGLFDGIIAAGEGANEDTFIDAVKAATARLKTP